MLTNIFLNDKIKLTIYRKDMDKMKKVLSILLVITLVFAIASPATSALYYTDPTVTCETPTIYISGDSNNIYYNDDTESFKIDDILAFLGIDDDGAEEEEEEDDGAILEASMNILLPFIFEGIISGEWDNYYAAVEKEIGDLFEPVRLDENGNIPEGSDSGIGKERTATMQYNKTHDKKDSKGRYGEKTYEFFYDWRLDPMELADELHEYIEGIKLYTGHDQVTLNCRCLGTNVALAYIAKYGTDSLKGFGIDVATSNGADFLSGIISGDFGIDGNAIVRLIMDLQSLDSSISVSPVITSTIELLSNTGVLDTLTDVARRELYAEIEYGIISALATATFLTFPCYWALVSPEDLDTALTYVFGEEGSEKRVKYAGLIEKITTYNDTVKVNVDDILKATSSAGVNLCIISKYGTQMVPVLKDGSILGDQYVSVEKSSFGATTSTLYETLSDEYIAERTELGYGKYISPDKQIDASTCLFPDYTWFIKGCAHGFYSTNERDLILTTIDADRQLTVNDFQWTQFIVFSYDTVAFAPMTEENCNTESWGDADSSVDNPETKDEKLSSMLKSLFKWLRAILEALTQLLSK